METAFLLIALGFGYKVFAEASANNKKQLKQLGRIVGLLIMIVSAASAACATYSTMKCALSCPTENCPMHGPKFGRGMLKGFGSKMNCPFSGTSATKTTEMMGAETK